jgi:hypothetical protein
MSLKLSLKRVSQLPNANRQFCYHIVSGDTTGISGVVTRDDGQRMFWSFTRMGVLNKPFNANVDLREATDRGGTKGKYLNLADTVADGIGGIAYTAGIAERAGLDRTAVHAEAAKKIFGGSNEVTNANPVNQPASAEVTEPAATEPVTGATAE